MRKQAFGILAAITSLVFTATSTVAQEYPIKLTPSFQAGQKCQLRSKSTYFSKHTITSESKVLKQKDSSIVTEGAAEMELISVNENGQPTALILNIQKLSKTAEQKTTSLLPANSAVRVELDGGKVNFRVKDEAVSPQVESALVDMLGTLCPNLVAMDKLFGTTERKRVGEEWDMNKELVIQRLLKTSFKVDPKETTGSVKLTGITATRGTTCLRVTAKLSFPNLPLPLDIPQEMAVKKSSMELTITELLPVDGKTGPLQIIHDNTAQVMATGKDQDGRPLQLSISFGQVLEQHLSY